MKNFTRPLKDRKLIIGVVHIPALPGTPQNRLKPQEIIKTALEESRIYENEGISTIIIENMHDVPYLNKTAGPEIVSMMAVIGHEIKSKTNLHCGIQILAAANNQALSCAYSAGLDFIRAEGFVFAHVADEGIINSDAGELLRYRKSLGAESIAVLTDIKKKHSSHSITSDITLAETAETAEFFGSDGIIITGRSTGKEADLDEVKEVKDTTDLPVLIGSGINEKNISAYLKQADGFIVGSHFKVDGNWYNSVDAERVKKFVGNFNSLNK